MGLGFPGHVDPGTDGTLGAFKWHCHPITPSPHHPVTLSPCHPVTLPPHHPITPSPCHPVTQSPSHPVTATPSRITSATCRSGPSRHSPEASYSLVVVGGEDRTTKSAQLPLVSCPNGASRSAAVVSRRAGLLVTAVSAAFQDIPAACNLAIVWRRPCRQWSRRCPIWKSLEIVSGKNPAATAISAT